MPEGPEVKLYCNDLDNFLTGHQLVDVKIHGGKYKKSSIKELDGLLSSLPLQIEKAKCKGKFIYVILENNWYIWFTLGMAGGLTTEKGNKHNNVEFIREDGDSIFFNDPRNFGNVILCSSKNEMDAKLKSLGPSFLDESVPFRVFKKIATDPKVKDWPLYRFLVAQEKISGIGNYLRAEIMYGAKLSPFLKMGDLSELQLKTLYKNTKEEIENAYARQMKHYKFYNAFKVYRQNKDLKGNPVKCWEDENKRAVWWVPNIQGSNDVPGSRLASELSKKTAKAKTEKVGKKVTKSAKVAKDEVTEPVVKKVKKSRSKTTTEPTASESTATELLVKPSASEEVKPKKKKSKTKVVESVTSTEAEEVKPKKKKSKTKVVEPITSTEAEEVKPKKKKSKTRAVVENMNGNIGDNIDEKFSGVEVKKILPTQTKSGKRVIEQKLGNLSIVTTYH